MGRWGVRARLWAYWFVQTLEGSLCVILALITLGFDAPWDQGDPSLTPFANVDGKWVAFEPSGDDKFLLAHCGVREEPLTDKLKELFPADSVFWDLNKVVLMEDPSAGGENCICHSGTAPAVVALLFCFSVCVQAAEGLSFGIVPYISRPEHGGMFFKAGALGSYDPQIIKPPEGYRGADSVIMPGEEKPEKAASEAKGEEVVV